MTPCGLLPMAEIGAHQCKVLFTLGDIFVIEREEPVTLYCNLKCVDYYDQMPKKHLMKRQCSSNKWHITSLSSTSDPKNL